MSSWVKSEAGSAVRGSNLCDYGRQEAEQCDDKQDKTLDLIDRCALHSDCLAIPKIDSVYSVYIVSFWSADSLIQPLTACCWVLFEAYARALQS
jgi:hypothetical protein